MTFIRWVVGAFFIVVCVIFAISNRDLIDLQFWPIFNLADAGIVVGVGSLVYYLWKQDKNGLKAKSFGARNSDA